MTAAPVHSARTLVLVAIGLTWAGSVFGLTVGRWLGGVDGLELALIWVSLTFSSGVLLLLWRRPFQTVPWVAAVCSAFFLAYLTAGALLAIGDPSLVGSLLVYLLWFFPLLAFNRFANVTAGDRLLSAAIVAAAVAFAALRMASAQEPVEIAVLGVYVLSLAMLAVALELFARYREAWIQEQERGRALVRTHEAVRASEARFRELFGNAASGVGWLDADGRCQHLNATFCRMLGAGGGALAGERIASLVHPDDRAHWRTLFDALVRGQRDEVDTELRLLAADGCERWIRISVAPVKREDGTVESLVFVCLDNTAARAVEAQLRQSQRLESLGQLTGGIAHDFNNLLTVILGNAEALELRLAGQPDLLRLVGMSREAAERGAALTNQLLAFARRQSLTPQTTDVGERLKRMTPLLERTLGEQVELDVRVASDAWPALVDETQLESAVLNLCINARDAMPDGGALLVEVDNAVLDRGYSDRHVELEPGEYVAVSVSDTGTGMSEAVRARAFEPFYTTKEQGRGTGLGLAMVYGFAKQSGGHATVYSEPGNGTTVRLYLPRTSVKAVAGDAPESRPCGGLGTGSGMILLVEDDGLVRALAAELLRSMGYRLRMAASGPEALEVLKAHDDVDMLFTDVVMPGGLNGPALARQAQELRPGLKVLYTSGYSENAMRHAGRLEPEAPLLSKPYRRDELARKLDAVLNG